MECEAEGHDMCVMSAELQGGGILRQGVKVHAEKIHREFTVDIVKLVFIFAVVFFEVSRINFSEVVKIIGTPGVYTFMHDKVPAFFFRNKGMAAVWTGKTERCCDKSAGAESLAADLTLVLAITAIIIIDEMVGSAA